MLYVYRALTAMARKRNQLLAWIGAEAADKAMLLWSAQSNSVLWDVVSVQLRTVQAERN